MNVATKIRLSVIRAIAETIREVGTAPKGPMYAALMGAGVQLDEFTGALDTLVRAGLVTQTATVAKWTGPA